YDKDIKTTFSCSSGCKAVLRRSRSMKCLFWKCCILFIALALLLALGAFAEGTFGLPLTAACCLAGYHAMRAAWAAEQRAESRAAMRRARRTAAAGFRRPDASKARRPESLRAA